jgi:hypothetical protein
MQHRTIVRSRVAAGACLALAFAAVVTARESKDLIQFLNPPAANPETPPASGLQANQIASPYSMLRIAQGSDPLENPSGTITKLGFLSDGTATEPDENTYLVFDHNPGGPTPGYDYGRRFLFQGHENAGNNAYLTRINLDVTDPAHRITLLSPVVPALGLTGFNSIDGSSWDPFTRTMLFTQEAGANGGVLEVPAEWSSTTPPPVRSLACIIGKAGYEGIHPDRSGNLLLVEDTSGASASVDPTNINGTVKVAKQPNSFVYKFIPFNPADMSQGGDLYALQIRVDGSPLSFGGTTAQQVFNDVYSTQNKDLRDGQAWPAQWVFVHHSGPVFNFSTCQSFDANAAAKTAGATPFKRPENGQFIPGSNFNSFVFDETGDTDTRSSNVPELAQRGAWGSLFRVDFPFGNAVGTIRLIATGDADHASFDNITFATDSIMLVAEDRGDMLHDQLNKLDSVWAYDLEGHATRFIALGRDVLAAPNGAEDNEPTGAHVSEGDTSIAGLVGTTAPGTKAVHLNQIDPATGGVPPGLDRARWFVTQQHGLNQVFQLFLIK